MIEFNREFYFRDEPECILCESMHSRQLGKVEVLVQGKSIYEIDYFGRIIRKKYGRWERWEILLANDRVHTFVF